MKVFGLLKLSVVRLSTAVSVAGVILLAGTSFGQGAGLRWGHPHLVSANTVDNNTVGNTASIAAPAIVPPAIVQTQYIETQQLPPAGATTSNHYTSNHYITTPNVQHQSSVASPSRNIVDCSNQISLKSIKDISHDIRLTNVAELPQECVLEGKPFQGRFFTQSCVQWKASGLATKAAYFEDEQLERHGHTIVHPALQPVVSGVKFFGNVVFLPYKAGVHPPNECVYTLGHRRVDSCAPYMVEPLPISLRGAVFQAGAVLGGIAACP